MFKITFISTTLANLLVWAGCIAIGVSAGPNSSDPAFVIGFMIGGSLGAAAVGLVAGGIAVLMFRPSAIRA